MKNVKKRKVYSVSIFASIAAFFALLGLILSFLPLRMFALIPASIAIYFSIIAYILTRVFKTNKKFVYIVFGVSILSIAIASITESLSSNVVVEDKEFEQKLTNQTPDIDSSLNAAFEEEIEVEVVKEKPVSTVAKQDTIRSKEEKDNVKQPQPPAKQVEEEFVEEDIGEVEF